MAMALEECLLEACKTGDLATVQAALGQGCDVNCGQGYGLRRAVRYNHPNIWKTLLAHPEIKVGNRSNFDIWSSENSGTTAIDSCFPLR